MRRGRQTLIGLYYGFSIVMDQCVNEPVNQITNRQEKNQEQLEAPTRPNTTLGGVPKRRFKPNVPSKET